MKFLDLKIANYRGITSAEITFAPSGITLIQGPNEAGKTSLAEAIGLLFEFPDSSKHRRVQAIIPVHRDAGPEIALHAQSGPYEFVYFKRYAKNRETKLTITKPKPESLTGGEAHDRANVILAETLDVGLWKALAIQQGTGIEQPDLASQTSLSVALDRAAGGSSADPRGEDLFDRIHVEYLRYYSKTGAAKKELNEAETACNATKKEVSDIEEAISRLESDIDRAAKLEQELKELKTREEKLDRDLANYSTLLEEVTRLESSLEKARLKLETAKKEEEMARRDKQERQGLKEAVSREEKTFSNIEKSIAESLVVLNDAEKKLSEAENSFNDFDEKKKASEKLARLRREDFDYYTSKLHLEQLQERKDRIDTARADAARAEEFLKHNKVTDTVLAKVQNAEKELIAANARLETGAPSVVLTGLRRCGLSVDGLNTELGKDETRTISVADSSTIVIPDIVSIEVKAGSSIEGLSKKWEEARMALEKICRAAGVQDADEARLSFEARKEALRKTTGKAEVEKENLRDLSYEELNRKLLGLQQVVPGYLADRASGPPISPDLEAAKKEWSNSEEALKVVASEWEKTKIFYEVARQFRDELSAKLKETRVGYALTVKALENDREALRKARAGVSDDMLETREAEAIQAVAAESSNVNTAAASLQAKDPDRVRTLAETAKASRETTRTRRLDANTESTEVHTRLKIHGEEGLHEKLNMALSNLNRLEREKNNLFRRAGAAKYLFETMRDERDETRRAYILPIKEKVEKLCRLVFDSSCRVEISEDLQIVKRTLDDVTVPFESLSAGAREQLSLIFRLACSMIVATNGEGTPMVLDDVLGYTDEERLPLMGAVFARAAKDCQIVILTCVPDRYSNIGAATIIPLG